jgi:hypothetical protein
MSPFFAIINIRSAMKEVILKAIEHSCCWMSVADDFLRILAEKTKKLPPECFKCMLDAYIILAQLELVFVLTDVV